MRKTETITIQDGEQELKFKITQMPATRLERWINRVFLLVAKSGKEAFDINSIQDGLSTNNDKLKSQLFGAFKKQGLQGILKMIGCIDYGDFEPLWDELLSCCERVNGNHTQQCTSENLDTYVDEFQTIYKLKLAVLKVNFSFFQNVGNSPTENQEEAPGITITKITQM